MFIPLRHSEAYSGEGAIMAPPWINEIYGFKVFDGLNGC